MKLHKLPKTKTKKNKRIGRGYGSGKGGHTTVRGQKGQKSRNSVPLWFTGTSWVWFKRLPMLRGKGKFKPTSRQTITLDVSSLNDFRAGSEIDKDALVKQGLLKESEAKTHDVKILGNGKLEKKIKLNLKATKSVIKQVEKLGGEYLRENS